MNRSSIFACVVVFCGLAAEPVLADPLVISVGTVQAAPGQDVEVPISMKGASDLGAMQFRLSYDPAVLEGKKVDLGPAAANAGLMDFAFGEDGRAGIGLGSTQGMTGEGVIFKVLFHVRGAAGQLSPLKIDAARAWDAANVTDMQISSQDGQLSVIASYLAFPLWWIAAAVGGLMFLLLIVFGLLRSHRSPNVQLAVAGAAVPTYGVEATFKHHCGGCQQVIELPQSALGKQFKCAGCGAMQVGGR